MTASPATRPRVPRRLDLRRLPLPALVLAAIVPLALLLVVVGWSIGRLPAAAPAAVGTVAPDFTLTDLDGRPVRLADLRGRPVIVNFWASWCGPCIEEFPLLRDAALAHADDGLAIVGIVYHDRVEAARAFMDRHGGTWPAAMDPGDTVANAYGMLGPPQTYFIGRDGRVVARQIGQISAASLHEKLAAILDEGA
jgi:cytochrome c biogenesis protein CcmG, thiol:disulfide interchange protein DsbE